jgi:hypothetical protein
MTANTLRPVLMLGGYGSLGARTTRMLRRLYPDLPITIVCRDLAKAAALAEEVGNATAALVDLHRADLGLSPDMIPDDAGHSVVVTALRDHSLNTMRYAQARRIPYVALSDAAFEIGPLVARYVHRPAAAPILMLGHGMGAVPTLSALHFARGFKAIEAIEIGFVFDPDDPFGPLSASDMERISKVGPSPLLLRDGRWRWAGAEEGTRRFAGVDGAEHQGHAVGLVDGLSLWSSTTARSIRVDAAEGLTASSRRGQGPSHEVVIEITGERTDGGTGRYRYELVDPQGYAAMSARGVAVAVERLLGLAGGPPPAPGLYLPEALLDPSDTVRRLEALGVQVTENRSTRMG